MMNSDELLRATIALQEHNMAMLNNKVERLSTENRKLLVKLEQATAAIEEPDDDD